ncbi:helix-turn-helix domain-containing protein [Aliivibrio fischeri]|uniref:helix-turn-helix domain-containing protein n=1 Tax=Aliivibrio fischeri TaxID=668 RepID=UPI003013CD6D
MNNNIDVFVNRKERLLTDNMSLNVYLTKYEFKLFICLLELPGVNQANDDLINRIWNDDKKDNSNLIQLISKTRRHLKPLEHVFKIKSQRGEGYSLEINRNYTFVDHWFKSSEMKSEKEVNTFILDLNDRVSNKEIVLLLLVSIMISIYVLNRTMFFPDFKTISDDFVKLNCSGDSVILSTTKLDCSTIKENFSKSKSYVLSTFDEKVVYTEK